MKESIQTIEKNPFRKTTIFYMARGPIIVFTVISSLLFPYIKEYCTLRLMLHLAIANLGLVWIYRDLSSLTESAIRSGLNLVFDKIVLDDVLRMIYDPVEGLWACYIGTYLGASSMYGLGMDEGQRTELIQSSLGLTDERQAHSVLLEPGGCKTLLPVEIQNWLMESQIEKKGESLARIATNTSASSDSLSSTDGGDLESDRIYSDNDSIDANSHETHSFQKNSRMREERDFRRRDDRLEWEPNAHEKQRDGIQRLNQADPVAVFFSIVQKMAKAKMKEYVEALPRSKIENVGIAATAAYGIQLALRRSSRKSSLLEHMCATIAIMSFVTNISREAYLGKIHNRQTMQYFCKDLASSFVAKIKAKSSNKGLAAMLFLILLCRRGHYEKGVSLRNGFQ